jgi:hypothetical protein
MKSNGNDERVLKRYLLGELTDERQERLEERLMTDNAYFEELQMVEDDLVDEYVREDLSSREKDRFDHHFLCTPERQRKLRFANALRSYIESAGAPESAERERREKVPSPFWQWFGAPLRAPASALRTSMAAALLLLVFGGMWLLVGNWRLQNRLNDALGEQALLQEKEQDLLRQVAAERTRGEELTEDLQREQSLRESLEQNIAFLRARTSAGAPEVASPPPTVASFLLTPGLLRGMGDMDRVVLPTGADLIQLHLDLGVDDYESYRITLHEAEGDEIMSQAKLKAETIDDRIVVVLTLPTNVLRYADYHLRLSGQTAGGDFELVERYYFRAIVD